MGLDLMDTQGNPKQSLHPRKETAKRNYGRSVGKG